MKEIYKQIETEPNYEVSNFGNIRNKITKAIKSQYLDKNGYYIVTLNQTHYRVHRLVAVYFVINPNNKKYTIVNHKDENKQNNNYDNLEWCDNKYNSNYGTNIERMASSLSKEKIIEYDINGKIINIYRSLSYVRNNIKHGSAIYDAILYNYYNRFYNNKYYFTETETFNKNRVNNKRIYIVYDKVTNKQLIKGDRRIVSKYLKISVKQFANYVNYYTSRNRVINILNYTIKIENV